MVTKQLEFGSNEAARLQELYRYDILDTSEEKDFDDLVNLAAEICETPIALISLVDQHRQWFKARTGVEIRETPRSISFCTHAIQYPGGMIVKDSSLDSRFQSNPFVKGANLRFYAGVPLTSSNGYNLGTLCVIDRKPKELTQGQLIGLRTLANQVMKLLDLRLNIGQVVKANKTVTESELRFRTLAESAPIGIYQTNVYGKGIYVNPKWCDIAGVREADALGTGWIRAIYESDRHKVLRSWVNAVAKKIDFNFEFRFQDHSAKIRWVKSHASPMFSEAGSFVGYVGTLEDITNRKVAEQKLKESELKYRLISTNSKDVIAIVTSDPIPVHTFLSPSVKEVLGYEPEELIGKSPFDLIYKDDLEVLKNEVHPASVSGVTQTRQNRVIKKDGSVIWVEIVSGPAYDDEGKEIGIMASIRDIHDQKLAEFKLEESERLFRLISSNSKDMLTIFEANEEARCVYVSPSCKEVLGYEPEELIGLSPFQMMPYDQAEELKRVYLKKLLDGESVRTESQLRKLDGTFIWVEALSQPIYNEQGQILTFQASVREISERKRFEKQLQEEKEKAEASTLAKSQFLSIMSHEIRTPMNAIIGLTNIMLEEKPRKNQLEKLNLLKFSGENLLSLINDILDYSKIEAGKVELENIVFNLSDILQKYVTLSESRAADKGIALKVDVLSKIPSLVIGDPTRLGQVLNNLIGNAIKFTEKGIVTLTVTPVQVSDEDCVIHFSVKDTGIGIKSDKLNSIFENFTQASSDTTRKYGGTGLGLSIAKKLLQLMGSEIKVASEFGVGTVFTFSIPFKVSKELETKRTAQEIGYSIEGLLKVLVVEDNIINQVVASTFLKKWGMTVAIANDGKEALDMMQENRYDLVLMDLQMPVMDGYEATQTIRSYEDPYFKTVPIFALSASAMLEEKEKAMKYGFNDFVTKPFQPQELKEKIIKVVRSKVKQS